MREIERRTTVKRRSFLRGTAAAPVAVAVASMGFDAGAAWAQAAKTLSPHVMATLARAARDIFPHDHLADRFYITAVSGYDAIAAGDAAKKAMLEGGVARLDEDAADKFKAANYLALGWEADRVSLLRGITDTPFFAKLRGDLVVTLYNQKELWPKFGYEGSSAEHGGYLHRGFNDIDWLPTA
jgi:hypothetical protein